eukprot:gene24372-biopygen7395
MGHCWNVLLPAFLLSVVCLKSRKAESRMSQYQNVMYSAFLLSVACLKSRKSRQQNGSAPERPAFCFFSVFYGMPDKQKSRKQNVSTPERSASCFPAFCGLPAKRKSRRGKVATSPKTSPLSLPAW